MLTRRSALRIIGAAAAAPKLARPALHGPFTSLAQVFEAPASVMFGIAEDGSARDPETLYSAATAVEPELSFDVSNNQILGSLTRSGELRGACAAAGVSFLDEAAMKGGVYTGKQLLRGGAWTLELSLDDGPAVPLHTIPRIRVDLIGGVFPLFDARLGGLRVRRLVFAPAAAGDACPPRALLTLLSLRNESAAAISANLRSSAVLLDDERIHLPPGRERVVAAAYLLGESDARLRSRTPLEWLNATWEARVLPYGDCSIPEAPYFAESIARFAETCRQSALRLPDGRVAGGFLGSDVDSRNVNWVRDLYYSMLSMSIFEPRLCADSILYFLRWNLPPRPVGRGLERFPGAPRVTQSLGNALAPLVLAGYYYQHTGDTAFLQAHPEILQSGRTLLDGVLASRRGEPFLFPSMFISDGDARGDYHTGSNIMAWKAFDSMARLARDVYAEPELGAQWSQTAARIREDIWTHCAGPGPLGRQLFEGSNKDGTFIAGHDGEESDTTLAPFYGFCASDDPALTRHARLAMSESNPFYSKDLDAIWWYNEKWASATFPGWITALAGATGEGEVAARLHRIRQLTDLDGSIWWWPYKYGTRDPRAMLRANNARKCGWASGLYLCRMVHDIAGVGFDLPARRVEFRPFPPWQEFSWKNGRIGAGVFDISYQRHSGACTAALVNRSAATLTALVELTAPPDAVIGGVLVNGSPSRDANFGERYGRPSARVTRELRPGAGLRLELHIR